MLLATYASVSISWVDTISPMISLSHHLALFELRCPVKCNLILIRSNLSGSPRFFFGSRSHRSPLQKDTTGAALATSAAGD